MLKLLQQVLYKLIMLLLLRSCAFSMIFIYFHTFFLSNEKGMFKISCHALQLNSYISANFVYIDTVLLGEYIIVLHFKVWLYFLKYRSCILFSLMMLLARAPLSLSVFVFFL